MPSGRAGESRSGHVRFNEDPDHYQTAQASSAASRRGSRDGPWTRGGSRRRSVTDGGTSPDDEDGRGQVDSEAQSAPVARRPLRRASSGAEDFSRRSRPRPALSRAYRYVEAASSERPWGRRSERQERDDASEEDLDIHVPRPPGRGSRMLGRTRESSLDNAQQPALEDFQNLSRFQPGIPRTTSPIQVQYGEKEYLSRSRSRLDRRRDFASRSPSSGSDRSAPPWRVDYIPRPVSPIIDEVAAFKHFEFAPSPLPATSWAESSRDGEISDNEPKRGAEPKANKTTPIHTSKYTGIAELGGSHSALLTTLHDLKGEKLPLFKWLHISQEVMSFDDFWLELSRNVRLSEQQTAAIAKLRANINKQCVKSRLNPKGSRVGYMEPRYLEVPLSTNLSSGEQNAGTVRWICMPYFALKQYSGLLAASDPTLFPSQTLLQTQYSRNTQKRDMEQAVCQLGTVKRNDCFHVDQLWCLVIHNSLLVTCGNMQQSDLGGDVLRLQSQPSREPTANAGTGSIRVLFEDSVVWVINAEDCPTWFSFTALFSTFWPQLVEFTHKNRVIKAENWPQILDLANRPHGSVALKIKMKEQPDLPARGVLSSEVQNYDASKDVMEQAGKYFHVLPLLLGLPESNENDSFGKLTSVLSAADKFLKQNTLNSTKTAYEKCAESTRRAVHDFLADRAMQPVDRSNNTTQRYNSEQIDLFNAADILYRFFLPSSFEGPTANKFWGALFTICTLPLEKSTPSRRHTLAEMRVSLRSLAQIVEAFRSVISQASSEEQKKIDAPAELTTAWLHIVAAVTSGSGDENNRFYDHITNAVPLITESVGKMVHRLSNASLLDKAAMLPMEVLSLIVLELLGDRVGKSDDICETYSQYLNSLDTDITTKPLARSYQRQIDLAQQELAAVKGILAKQKAIVSKIRKSMASPGNDYQSRQYREEEYRRDRRDRLYNSARYAHERPEYPPEDAPYRAYHGRTEMSTRKADEYMNHDETFANDLESASKLSPTDAGGFRALFLLECTRLLEQREYEFWRDSEYATDLERAVVFKISLTRDRQEDAIYAFTVVTIIFLPMSAVAGIFGMNTSDVRDMGSSQWLYWAVAIPVTLAVIIGGLWWMGELGNVVRWMSGKEHGQRPPTQPSMAVMQAASAKHYASVGAVNTEAPYVETGRLDRMGRADNPYVSDAPMSSRMSVYPSEYVPMAQRRAARRVEYGYT